MALSGHDSNTGCKERQGSEEFSVRHGTSRGGRAFQRNGKCRGVAAQSATLRPFHFTQKLLTSTSKLQTQKTKQNRSKKNSEDLMQGRQGRLAKGLRSSTRVRRSDPTVSLVQTTLANACSLAAQVTQIVQPGTPHPATSDDLHFFQAG